MSSQIKAIIKLQNFSGDATGNLFGNFGIYGITTLAGVDSISNQPFSSVSVTTVLVANEDPLVTLNNELLKRTDLGSITTSTL
jgi:hypothetical protein